MVSISYQSYYQRYWVTIDFQRFCRGISPKSVWVCAWEREKETDARAHMHARTRMYAPVHAHTHTGSKINKHIEPIGGGHQKLLGAASQGTGCRPLRTSLARFVGPEMASNWHRDRKSSAQWVKRLKLMEMLRWVDSEWSQRREIDSLGVRGCRRRIIVLSA